ncbi:MAG: cytochrome c [Hyphomicrobiaceae bacterium]
MTYKAVPLLSLLGAGADSFDTIEARATDGFVSQIPMSLVASARSGGSVPWIAVEDPREPWPTLPRKTTSAGPFFLVWQHPERSRMGPEQWPYALAALSGVSSPDRRWPQMAVATTLSADAPERRGLGVFVKHCLSCHKINGAGEASVGPDLARPMGPTEYMTEIGLRKLIRDPGSVRTWAEQKMAGFDTAALPDAELDDLLAYLDHIAKRRE